MKTVRFLRDTDPSREGGPGFTAGAIVALKDESARRWVNRSAAEYVKSEATDSGVAAKNQKASKKPVVTGDELDDLLGVSTVKTEGQTDVNAVEGSADVAGQNGGDSGNGSESEAAANFAGATGKGSRNRDK
jgi:hypothetical protein